MRLTLSFVLFLATILILGRCNKAHTPSKRLSWTFPADGITKLTVRSSRTARALVRHSTTPTIMVSGRPILAANGYHSPDPAGLATPAHEWAFEVTPTREGNSLTLTIKGETAFRQHHYFLDALEIDVPSEIEVIREFQPLNSHAQ